MDELILVEYKAQLINPTENKQGLLFLTGPNANNKTKATGEILKYLSNLYTNKRVMSSKIFITYLPIINVP